MRYTIVKSILQVIGQGHGSGGILYQYELTPQQLERMKDDAGQWSRESVDRWVRSPLNCGDFSSVTDWRAELEVGEETIEFGWLQPDSEEIWADSTSFD